MNTEVFHDRDGGELSRSEVEELRARSEDPEHLDCGWPRIGATGWKPL